MGENNQDPTILDAGNPQEGWQGPQFTDLESIEGMGSQSGTQQFSLDQELQGDAVPEDLRGKKVSDILGSISHLREALKLSESSRMQAQQTAQLLAEQRAQPTAPPAPAGPPTVQERTAEQWKELHDSDPFKYQEERFAALERRLAQGMDARVAPVTSTAASVAEQQARAQFPEEFEALGKEIKDFVQIQLGGDMQQMALPGAWERVVKYVRGENFDKMVEFRTTKRNTSDAAARQAAAQNNAPPAFSPARPPAPRPNGGGSGKITPATMDDTHKEIARTLMPNVPKEKAYELYCQYYI